MKLPAEVVTAARNVCQQDTGTIVGLALASPDTWVLVNFRTDTLPRGCHLEALATYNAMGQRVLFTEPSAWPFTPALQRAS